MTFSTASTDSPSGRNSGAGIPTDNASRGAADSSPAVSPGNTRALLPVCFLTSMLMYSTTFFFNGVMNDAFSTITDAGRDWSTVLGAAFFIVLAILAKFRPQTIKPRSFSITSLILLVGATVVSTAGFHAGSAALVIIGMCLAAIADVWMTVLWLLACSRLDLRKMWLCFAGATCVGIPWSMLVSLWGFSVVNVVNTISPLAIVLLAYPLTRGFFERYGSMGLPADTEIATPRTALPLGHRLFVYIFTFSLAFGYGMRYENASDSLWSNLVIAAILLLIALYALVRRDAARADMLFGLSFALILLGYLLVLLNDTRTAMAASTLLIGGYTCFNLLMWFSLCAIASRNTSGAIPAISWGIVANYLGIFIGAQSGILTTSLLGADSLIAMLIVVVIVAFMAIYVLATARSFSFDATIGGIAPDAAEPVAPRIDTLDARCDDLIASRGLTQREGDVLRQLAHGNNASHIQEALCISRNTVKYHARHIYEKTGVHSQQELIDLLASEDGSTGTVGPTSGTTSI